jgi:AcrR family transcriptional regulator
MTATIHDDLVDGFVLLACGELVPPSDRAAKPLNGLLGAGLDEQAHLDAVNASTTSGHYYLDVAQRAGMTTAVSRDTVRGRRRGQALEHAVFAAALAELTELGYGGLSMEGIAARAGTGKAALYRRWPTKRAVALAALSHAMPPPPQPRANRSARQNLMAIFDAHRGVLAGQTGFPGVEVIVQLLHDPEFRTIFANDLIAPRLQLIESVLRAAERDGEVAAGTITALSARIGPALILQHTLLTGARPTRRELAAIVDAVLPSGG